VLPSDVFPWRLRLQALPVVRHSRWIADGDLQGSWCDNGTCSLTKLAGDPCSELAECESAMQLECTEGICTSKHSWDQCPLLQH